MLDKIRKKTEDKSILILGFGREGKSTYKLLRLLFPEKPLTIADANTEIIHDPLIKKDSNVNFKLGDSYLDEINMYNMVIKSPGITLKNLIINQKNITSQTDLFLSAFGKQVVGITGTKGKSTTSTLIQHILTYAEKSSILLGNIGRPSFDHIEEITDDSSIIYEMSSHQLEFLSASPHIAVLLNYYQEHLDAYNSYLDYRLAKWNISKFQNKNDFFIANADDPLIHEFLEAMRPIGNLYLFSTEKEVEKGCFIRNEKIIFRDGAEIVFLDLQRKRKLQGNHNIRNIMAAMMVCKIIGTEPEIIAEAVTGFRGLEHRLEDCGTHNGIHFFNDSIATIPEACIAAIKSLGDVDTIILGGFDRGIDYSFLGEFLSKSGIRNMVITGEAGKRIATHIYPSRNQHIFSIDNFDQFIDVVRKVTKPGKICLLSPAAASYDEFPNFEIRGKRFKELIVK